MIEGGSASTGSGLAVILSAHLAKLEAAGYMAMQKEFAGRRPHTMIHLTDARGTALEPYRATTKPALEGWTPDYAVTHG